MSCRRPKLTYKRRTVQRSATSSTSIDDPNSLNSSGTAFLPISDAPRPKRPRNSKNLFLPGHEKLITLPGVSLTQPITNERSPRCSGDSTHLRAKRRRSTSPLFRARGTSHDENFAELDCPASELNAEIECDEQVGLRRETWQLKKERMFAKWTTLLPSLLPIYLRLLRETQSLRLSPNDISFSCTCDSARTLTVTCIFFQREH